MRHPYIFIIVSLILISTVNNSCSNNFDASGKNLAVTISGSRSFNPDIIHGQIDYYQITITAPDMDVEFTDRFDGDSSSARMLGIPSGPSRHILVEAFNPNGKVIRRGDKGGVTIMGGKSTHVEIVMNSVPIFTNINDKSAVSGSRVNFGIFGEPDSQLELLDVTGGKNEKIVDRTGKAKIDTSNEEGLFSVDPQEFSPGLFSFKIHDIETGESSTVTITLYESTVRPGLGINSGGYAKQKEEELILANTGQPYHREVGYDDADLGYGTLLDVIDAIY